MFKYMKSNQRYRPATQRKHANFFHRVGLRCPSEPDSFEHYLESEFGQDGVRVRDHLEKILEGVENSDQDFWDLKNQSLELSLFLSSQEMSDFYNTYLNWFDKIFEKNSPKNILDIGCENGILTCYYAESFPTANVLGIDTSKAAISCAQKLADQLDIENVTFANSDALNPSCEIVGRNFDLITSIMFYSNAISMPVIPEDWKSCEAKIPISGSWTDPLRSMSSILSSHGLFINVERLHSSLAHDWWNDALESAGLYSDTSLNTILCYDILGNCSRLPAFVCRSYP